MVTGGRCKPLLLRLLPAVLLLAAVFCWRLSVGRADALGRHSDLVSLREAGALSAAGYAAMAEREAEAAEPLPFALWTQLDNRQVADTVSGRSAAVAVVALRGDSRLVLPTAQVVAMDDLEGCLLDAETAVTLFGSRDAVGFTLEYGDAVYTVRGVVELPAPTLMVQLPEDSALPLGNVNLRGAAAAFAMRHGLEPALTVRYETFARMAGFLSGLPVAAAALLALVLLLRLGRRWRAYPLRAGLVFALFCGLFTLSVLGLLAAVPQEYVPTRWSDFDFWAQMATEWRAGAVALLAAAWLRPELWLLAGVARGLWGCVAAVLVVAAGRLIPLPWRGAP